MDLQNKASFSSLDGRARPHAAIKWGDGFQANQAFVLCIAVLTMNISPPLTAEPQLGCRRGGAGKPRNALHKGYTI